GGVVLAGTDCPNVAIVSGYSYDELLRGADVWGLVRIEGVRALAAGLWLAPQGSFFCNAMTQTSRRQRFLEDAQPDLFRLDPWRSWLPTARRFTPSRAEPSAFMGGIVVARVPFPTLRFYCPLHGSRSWRSSCLRLS